MGSATPRRLLAGAIGAIGVVAAAAILIAPSLLGNPPRTPEPSPTIVAAGSTHPATSSPAPPGPSPTATPIPSPTPSPTPLPTPAVFYAALDGLATTSERATRLPLAVMVDDNVAARPQAGFNAAAIVYQAPADGGEDRYMMVFQELDSALVGPVRSGRPYFVRWAAEYRAAFGHFGGDAKTLAYIPTIQKRLIYNVDALAGGGAAYWRDQSRRAPHNAYTETVRLRRIAERLGAPTTMPDGLGTRPFGDDLASDLRPKSGSITVPYHRGASTYAYDHATNSYLRSVAGKPQRDALSGARVTTRNVVVLFMRLSTDPESEPGYHRPVLAQIGTGKALVFRDGGVVVGTWRKDSAADLTRFYDGSGTEITLVRGRIFIQVVPTGTNVTYDAPQIPTASPGPPPLPSPLPDQGVPRFQ